MNTQDRCPKTLTRFIPDTRLFIPQQMKLAFTQGQENGEENPDKS